MKFKILAGLFVIALSLVMIQANAQSHQHSPSHGGVVVMFGSSDHIEAVVKGTELKLYLSDVERKELRRADFEFVKASLMIENKEEVLNAQASNSDSSEVVFTLPQGEISKKAGLKFTVKRVKGNTNTFTQALPLSKIPVSK